MPPIATEGPGGVPVLSADIGTSGPVYSHFEEWDEIRERCPAFCNEVDGGSHWVLTRFEAQREALQRVEIFSTESTIVSDPNPEYMLLPLLPLFLDPASHLKYRQLLPGDDRRAPRPRALRLHPRVRRCLSDAGVPHRLGSSARGRPTDGRLGTQDLPGPRRDRHRRGSRGQRRPVRLLRAVARRPPQQSARSRTRHGDLLPAGADRWRADQSGVPAVDPRHARAGGPGPIVAPDRTSPDASC